MKDMTEKLFPASTKYREIALFWRVPTHTIESIEANHPKNVQRCLQEVITYWLHGNTDSEAPAVNWQSAIDALRYDLVGKTDIGDRIEESFKEEVLASLKKK